MTIKRVRYAVAGAGNITQVAVLPAFAHAKVASELSYFSRCILEDLAPEPDVEEASCDLRVIEAILESAQSGKPVPLAPRDRARRPSLDQQQKKPPVGKQKPVNAPSPSRRRKRFGMVRAVLKIPATAESPMNAA